MSEFIEVRIHGQLFKLRAGEEEGYVQELAAYVNDVMQVISRQSNTVAIERIAIMAALNVTDTLFQQQRRASSDAKAVDERINRLITLSDHLLGE